MAITGRSRLVQQTRLAAWMQPFQQGFTAPTWQHVLVLIVGAILTPGRRTVAAALRITGLEHDPHFTNYHRVLNRNRWSSRWIARCLLRLLIDTLVPTGPIVIGLDDTLERRWGAKIKARGIYRDPVRSSDSQTFAATIPAGYSSQVNSSLRPFCAPISTRTRSMFCAGSDADGRSRLPSPRSAATSASKPN
jgi:DDE superfamily endonuclease